MAGNVQNLNIGPCWVFWGPSATARDLGYTQGSVKVNVALETTEIEVDQETEPVIDVIKKRTLEVTVPLAEYTLDNLLLAFPGAEIITDAVDPTKKKLNVKSAAGIDVTTLLDRLKLHPTKLLITDLSKDVVFPKAFPMGEFELTYDKENVKILELKFKAYPDANGISAIFGDETATA